MTGGVPDGFPLRVSGGAGSIDARYDDLEQLGRLYASSGDRLVGWARDDRGEAVDGDLVSSAPLAPTTFAEAEQAILAATWGPGGLAVRAATLEVEALCFGACVELYRDADAARHAVLEGLHYSLGLVAGLELPALLAGGTLGYAAVRWSGGDATGWVEDHPGTVEAAVGAGGGLLDGLQVAPLTAPIMAGLGLTGFHADTGAAAADLGDLLFGDWTGELSPDHPTDDFDHPRRRLGDLVDALGTTAAPDVPDGVFSVQELSLPDGRTTWVVQLPGTDDFVSDTVVRGSGSNLHLVAGEPTAYGEAVAQAMASAGVDPAAPVMLVGHSQGGMQAAALAADPDFGYHVTHVVTAGSPVAAADVPDDVTVLSLENTADVVPLLDGEPNPAEAHHVTVQADLRLGSLGAGPGQDHAVTTYAAIADAADADRDPSVRRVLAGMRAAGFLPGPDATSRTTSFQAVTGGQVRPADIAGIRRILE